MGLKNENKEQLLCTPHCRRQKDMNQALATQPGQFVMSYLQQDEADVGTVLNRGGQCKGVLDAHGRLGVHSIYRHPQPTVSSSLGTSIDILWVQLHSVLTPSRKLKLDPWRACHSLRICRRRNLPRQVRDIDRWQTYAALAAHGMFSRAGPYDKVHQKVCACFVWDRLRVRP